MFKKKKKKIVKLKVHVLVEKAAIFQCVEVTNIKYLKFPLRSLTQKTIRGKSIFFKTVYIHIYNSSILLHAHNL